MQKRIIVLVLAGIIAVLASMWTISVKAVKESIAHSLQNRMEVSRIIGRSIDNLLHENLIRLGDIGITDDKNHNHEILKSAYQYSIFSGNLHFLDKNGELAMAYPGKMTPAYRLPEIPKLQDSIKQKKESISDIYTLPGTNERLIFAVLPLTDKSGTFTGTVLGAISPSNYKFKEILKSFQGNDKSAIYLVDGNGNIISSNKPRDTAAFAGHNKYIASLVRNKKEAVGKCHRCHDKSGNSRGQIANDVLVFHPLSMTSWGIVLTDPEDAVYGASTKIQLAFLITGSIYILCALLLAFGLSKSIVSPINRLIDAARKIADGDLSKPIHVSRRHEIGLLAESFDLMRGKLNASLENIKTYNIELENLVYERTKKLEERNQQRAILLKQTLMAQEDERKRIARELHDETSQSILSLGMALELSSRELKENRLAENNILALKKKTADLLDGINRLIHDLRPPVLDDLDFKSAISWLLEKRLVPAKINYKFNASPEFSGIQPESILDKHTGLRLFRIIQEAIANVARHSRAENVILSLIYKSPGISVTITDDGIGFNPDEALKSPDSDKSRGYGLLGMIERAEHINGNIEIRSEPGKGTTIIINLPAYGKGD